ncbi:hypothetical protein GCK72_017927 [Caenorhabditis remanei]|uniref:U2A'/phosphoprotein 32 family A C-terminal domain-containing protein n=1 Tax=Caenorhabditis remanei TaxID=31234 RepID=A0A6A5G9K7_CAERE|nr:hypothetical protein GCK72_017927 [Caenorhabditis remanei]KAF1751373.1 hypothetical protein GCK72_017927 [Caenorhabditis remanei]
MPNLLATASQVANSLSNLKAKYIKYLETLCSANGIDISTLKTEGDSHKILEMYFGGLPVLVGLKYFSHLSTLRLFGQQITCLKPLGEVAPTLEELWVCEGAVKDLAGIDHCVRLKKLFLYDNSIEDATCLSALTNLQYLSLASNKLKSLTFIRDLKDLTNLSLADNKMKDSVMATAIWPENIQHLDLSANYFSSNRALFPLTMLSSLRSLNIDPVTSQSHVAPNLFFAWIAHSFRFIESIDDDPITESFVSTFRPMIDTIFAEKLAKLAKADEKYHKDLRMVEKHSGKIENRLACLAEALTVYKDAMQTKDAKKEIVKRVHEICVNNSKAVKNIKKRLFILEKDSTEKLFDLRTIFNLLDRFTRKDYTKHPVRLARDFEVIKKQAKEKTTIFFIPLVLSKTATSRGASKFIDEDGMSSSNDNLSWPDISLVAVLAVEIQPIGQLTTDQLRHMDLFEESYNEQLKKLNEMNIKLDVKEERHRRIDEPAETSIEAVSNQQSKIRKVSDVLANISNLTGRACDEKLPFDWFTIRNPLEIALAYFDFKPIKEISDMMMRLTALELCDQKLTKLAGIQELVSLQYLSLRKNKLSSLKKLNRLPCLKLLDASFNHIAKLEQLPSSLLHLDLSHNRLQTLNFCQSLGNARHLRVHRNQIKSMKGVESCVQLETLFINDNLLKDKNELELLKTMPKLTHLDMSSNPLSAAEGYRSRVMQAAHYLISLDRQIIPLEERHVNTMKQTTRGLSLELIERILSHIRLIDLSKNRLSSVREISSFNITHLILNNNCLKTIAITDGQSIPPFPCLENLDISNNSINNTTILRLGIPLLLKLKFINLSSNALSRFDCTLFDTPNLESIDLSNNSIKTIIRRPLRALTSLNLQNNKLTTLTPLSCSNLISLDISNNKLASCASLKPLCEFKSLETLDCRNNSVTERRVYVDFIKANVPSVKRLDDEQMSNEIEITKRRLSRANDLISMSRRSSMVTSSMLSWFEREEGETLDNVKRASSFLEPSAAEPPLRPRRLEPLPGRRKANSESNGLMLLGTKRPSYLQQDAIYCILPQQTREYTKRRDADNYASESRCPNTESLLTFLLLFRALFRGARVESFHISL